MQRELKDYAKIKQRENEEGHNTAQGLVPQDSSFAASQFRELDLLRFSMIIITNYILLIHTFLQGDFVACHAGTMGLEGFT